MQSSSQGDASSLVSYPTLGLDHEPRPLSQIQGLNQNGYHNSSKVQYLPLNGVSETSTDERENGDHELLHKDSAEGSSITMVHSSRSSGSPPSRALKRKRDGYPTDERGSSYYHRSLSRDNALPISPKHRGHGFLPKMDTIDLDPKAGFIAKRTKFNESLSEFLPRPGKPNTLHLNSTSFTLLLPAELWQRIFCFVPPVFLGRLLCVSKAFCRYLDPSKGNGTPSQESVVGFAKPIRPEAIWIASRRRFCSGLPKPLRGLSELEMWRLLRGTDCQICGKLRPSRTDDLLPKPWEAGPGANDVRIIWPYAIRCCGKCLNDNSEKEINLDLFSKFPRYLKPALSFAFVSESNNFIPFHVMQASTFPQSLALNKLFYKPHLEDMDRKLEEAKNLGSAAAEEWIKGLDQEGKDLRNHSARWEVLEAKGGLKAVTRSRTKKIVQHGEFSMDIDSTNIKNDKHFDSSLPRNSAPEHTSNREHLTSILNNPATSPYTVLLDRTALRPPHTTVIALPEGLPKRPLSNFRPNKTERNIQDVNEAKAQRRAEIERRCLELRPPIEPSVLHHMESFQAAIQISTDLTDQAWNVLKPRLLAQRDHAERREEEETRQNRKLAAKTEERRQQEADLKETRDALDRDWDEVQAPIRNRLAFYADEYTSKYWRSGKDVTKNTSPKFAADILIHVRERFYGSMAMNDAAAHEAGESITVDISTDPPTRALTLENMKWVFDLKVKPFTEHFQKELFLCNGCEGNSKFYGFEGVVQHYAAKHTSTLSLGSMVVHWRAEWPECPPFHPNPTVAKAQQYAVPIPGSTTMQGQVPVAYPNRVPYSENFRHIGGAGPEALSQNYPRAYTPQPYQPMYSRPPQAVPPYPQPMAQSIYHYSQGIQGPMSYRNGIQYNNHFVRPDPYYQDSGNNFNGFTAPPNENFLQSYNTSVPNQEYIRPQKGPYRTSYWDNNTIYPINPTGPPISQQPSGSFHQNSINQVSPGVNAGTDLYRVQMDEMARHAREVWFATSGIKDIPSSVRISVVIYHVVARFEAKYTNEPSLAMFIDGLKYNSLMRPVRSLNGLACRTCVTSGNSLGPTDHSHPRLPNGNLKLYTLPHLLNHFRDVHVERAWNIMPEAGVNLVNNDWKRDMIELPDLSLITDMINAPGMDDTKLRLIASAFPHAFPMPLPKIDTVWTTSPVPVYKGDNPRYQESPMSPIEPTIEVLQSSPARLTSKAIDFRRGIPYRDMSSPSQLSTASYEPARDDEYDPHRPNFLGSMVKIEQDNSERSFGRSHNQRDDREQALSSDICFRMSRGQYLEHAHDPAIHSQRLRGIRSPVSPIRPRDVVDKAHYGSQLQFRSGSPRQDASSRAHYRHHTSLPDHFDDPAYPVTSISNTSPKSRLYGRPSEDGEVGEDVFSIARGDSQSPKEDVQAAQRFLDSLPLSKADEGQSSEQTPQTDVASRIEDSNVRSDLTLQEKVETQQRTHPPELAKPDRTETLGTPAHLIRTDPLGPRDGDSASPRGVSVADFQYARNHPLTRSQTYTHNSELDENFVNTHSSTRHGELVQYYDRSKRKFSQSRSKSRYERPITSKNFEYRGRSKSPQPYPLDAGYYRARSPIPIGRHEAVYHLHSPVRHQHIHPRQVIDYEYAPPTDHYEYITSREPSESRYGERVQYVPVRMDERNAVGRRHYVLAPPEQHIPPGYIRVERAYSDEPMYGRPRHSSQANSREYEHRRSLAPSTQD